MIHGRRRARWIADNNVIIMVGTKDDSVSSYFFQDTLFFYKRRVLSLRASRWKCTNMLIHWLTNLFERGSFLSPRPALFLFTELAFLLFVRYRYVHGDPRSLQSTFRNSRHSDKSTMYTLVVNWHWRMIKWSSLEEKMLNNSKQLIISANRKEGARTDSWVSVEKSSTLERSLDLR